MDPADLPAAAPAINEVLARFLEHCCRGRQPVTVDRYLRINEHLKLFLETRGQDHVCAEDARWLAFERQFQPYGAFCRLLRADALLAALPEFLGGSWLMPHGVDCRVQASQSSRLVHWLICRGLVDFRRQQQDLVRFRAALDARQAK
ncbi:hypothetical protein [Arthrobacter mobilis]|uniref:Phage integrase, N-terminal SAM-like domain n=1 Tax=Arthrobacter mobilis TaxID=2724944 RepID=A0A7X6HAJ7_9MICC|nr:hypothetical protein [Arthrobacter mobilis]NKX53517.1 hypothetical protein [Arthrobacter mobilis]